jgi:hypothetical protein
VRVQKGAQLIWGFEFGADVTMDMKENAMLGGIHGRKCILDFKCVSSQFFSQFDGSCLRIDHLIVVVTEMASVKQQQLLRRCASYGEQS